MQIGTRPTQTSLRGRRSSHPISPMPSKADFMPTLLTSREWKLINESGDNLAHFYILIYRFLQKLKNLNIID